MDNFSPRSDNTSLPDLFRTETLAASCEILSCALTGSRRARGLGIAVWALWIGAAVATTPAVLAAYRTPVDSPRGRLLGTPSRARETQQVLTYLAQQPPEQRILILRGEPLYYFLSGRRIPARFDLLVPGLFAPEDDPGFAAGLGDVDQVIYNPRESALVPRPLVAYAPATAAALARGFRIVETLGDAAVVLRPTDAAARERTVVDLWESSEELAAAERTSWLMYRVMAVDLETEGESCFEQRHRAAKGESVTAVPIFHPRTWLPVARDSEPVRFSIRVEGQTSEHEGVPGVPGPPLRLPLDSFAEREIEIRFCVSAPGAAPDAMSARELGWAEARIVRAP